MKRYLTKKNVLIAVGVLLIAMLFAPNAKGAEVSGTVGAESDYIWRGINQSQGLSVQANLNLELDSGLYAGAWVGQVEFDGSEASEEMDYYVGFNKSYKGVDIDVMYYDYGYRGDDSLNFEEVSVGLGLFDNKVNVVHVIGMDDAPNYSEVELSMGKDEAWATNLSYGFIKDFGSNWKISKSMDFLGGTFDVGYTQFIADPDNALVEDEDGIYIGFSRKIF